MYMNEERVKEILDFVKAPPHSDNYGRWGALNPEQRRTISELCNSWLMLNDIVERYRILTGGTFEEPKEEIQVLSRYSPPKEDKKIEHLKLHAPYPECTDDRFEDVENKINEIIEKINGDNNEQNRS